MPTKLFKPMLAAKPDPDEIDVAIAKLPFPALFSPKLDGIRCTVQNGKLYARSLKLIQNKAMQKLWGRKEFNGLDGELIVGPPTAEDCFNRTTGQVRRVDGGAEDAVFYVFDSYSEVEPFIIRLGDTGVTIAEPHLGGTCGIGVREKFQIEVVPHTLIKSLPALRTYEARMTKKGYEGIMRRSLEGAYKQGRSTLKEGGLIAIKRTVDAEAIVLDTYEQMENTNVKKENELGRMKRSSHKAGKVGKGTLGGFVVMGLEDHRALSDMYAVKTIAEQSRIRGLTFQIGTGVGLTELVRQELWKKRTSLKGKIIKFRYQKVGTMEAPRQPIFLGFRDERDL